MSLLSLTAQEERVALTALGRLEWGHLTPGERAAVDALYRKLNERERIRATWDTHSAKTNRRRLEPNI